MADSKERDHCERCGKLFAANGRTLCHACARAESATPESSPGYNEEDGLISHAQRRFDALMRQYEERTNGPGPAPAPESAAPGKRPGCSLCGSPRIENSDLCVDCHGELYRSLGDAAEDLFGHLQKLPSKPARVRSVIDALAEARQRTATSRINPVATRKLRT